MFSQALSGVLVTSILLATSISTSFAQNDDSDFIKSRNSYPLWNSSLKRDIQGFKPGMTESEAKQLLSDWRQRGICPAIPYRSNTKDTPAFFPKTLYKARARIEQAVGKLNLYGILVVKAQNVVMDQPGSSEPRRPRAVETTSHHST
jgi:hypothetical protein